MRASVDKDDIGFVNFIQLRKADDFDILLNGESVDACITADEEKGFVIVHDRNEEGRFYANEEGTETVKKKLYGKVEIISSKRGELG